LARKLGSDLDLGIKTEHFIYGKEAGEERL